jgi:radical SAM protein with 4Fe4S-binding SPASM domain
MCYVIHENTQGELTTQEWFNVFDQLADMGTMYLELTGGEIFVRRDFWEILAYANKKKFLMHLFTNASYINEERAKRLTKFKNIMGFSVSIYGGDAETFDKVTHVKGAYGRVANALDILQSHGMKVKAKTPVTVENVHTVDDMKSLAKGALCASYQCAPLITPRDDGDAAPTDDRLADEAMRDILRVQTTQQIEAKNIGWDSPTCSAGRSLMGISPMGDVSPCIEFTQKSGNVRDKAIADIWYSHELDYIRDFTFGSMEKCQTCSVTQFCSPCVGLNQQERNSIQEPSDETCRISTLTAETYREQKRLKVIPNRPAGVDVAHCAVG